MFEEGLLNGLALWFSAPALVPVILIYDSLPGWFEPILEFLASETLNGEWCVQHFFWIFLTGVILIAMPVLGSRGRWWLAAIAVIGLTFSVLTVIRLRSYF